MARTITDVLADIDKLNGLWGTATQQYNARKTSLAAEVDGYIAAHQGAADNHAAEIKAANAVKAKLVPVVAGAETINSFLLTEPWYQRLVAFFKRNWRWVVYGSGFIGLCLVAVHLHK